MLIARAYAKHMSQLLLYYERPEPATWVFLSSFLLLSIYFVFHRFFSIRNLDILLLILLAPGLMMVYESRKIASAERSSVESQDLVETAFAGGSVELVAGEQQLGSQQVNQGNGGRDSLQRVSALRPSSPVQSPDQPTRLVTVREEANPGSVAADPQGPAPDPAVADLNPPALENPAQSDTALLGEYPPTADKAQGWSAESLEFFGFAALLLACLLLLIRMLIDPCSCGGHCGFRI